MNVHSTRNGILSRLLRSLRPLSRGQIIATLVLLVCLAATAWSWQQSHEMVKQEADTRFQFRVTRTLKAIEQRMAAYEQVLRGGVAFMNNSGDVTRESWQAYISDLALEENYPGLLGTGYVAYKRSDQIPELERQVRSEGFPDFKVWPKTERDDHVVVLYLEPFSWRNQRAFGYDMLSQSTRLEAIFKARDEGRTVVSGRVLLMQETAQDIQSGFLMYLPVYKGGVVPTTVAERREKLIGLVYSPFRMADLMRSILDRAAVDLPLRIFDGPLLDESRLVYGGPLPARQPMLETIRSININGHTWTIYMASPESLEQVVLDSKQPVIVLLTGLLISFLLFALLWSNAGVQARATAMAQVMTDAFRRSEAKFFSLVQAAKDAIIITDSAGLIVSWNQGATEMFGYREDAVLGKPWTMILPERLRDEYIRGQRAALGGYDRLLKRVLELTAVRDNGEEFPVEVSLTRWGVGGETFLSAIIRDTSERQQAEEALRLSEARFRTTFENAGIGIMLTELDGRIVEANPALGRMLGYTTTSLRQLDQNMLIHSQDRHHSQLLVESLTHHQKPFVKQQNRYLRKDGSTMWGNLMASLILDDKGEPLTLLHMIEDVTELREAEDALSQAYLELEQRVEARTQELRLQTEELARSNAELEQFAYVASHDLQEPLRSVSGFAQLLQRRYQDQLGEEGQSFLHYIVTGTDRMRTLIKDLLTYSRAGAKEQPQKLLDTEAVLNDVIASLSARILERDAEIVTGPLPDIWADKTDLTHLFQNLITNALKFNHSSRPRIEIQAEEQAGEWLFSVRDNGIGIDPEFSERLFTIFQRGHRRDDFDGTGIGLAICKKVVESYHGRIWAEPNLEEGTTFFFILPKTTTTLTAETAKPDTIKIECP